LPSCLLRRFDSHITLIGMPQRGGTDEERERNKCEKCFSGCRQLAPSPEAGSVARTQSSQFKAAVSTSSVQLYPPWPVAVIPSIDHAPDILPFCLAIRQSGWDRNVGDATWMSKIGRHSQQLSLTMYKEASSDHNHAEY
jgi:hypothetical protein